MSSTSARLFLLLLAAFWARVAQGGVGGRAGWGGEGGELIPEGGGGGNDVINNPSHMKLGEGDVNEPKSSRLRLLLRRRKRRKKVSRPYHQSTFRPQPVGTLLRRSSSSFSLPFKKAPPAFKGIFVPATFSKVLRRRKGKRRGRSRSGGEKGPVADRVMGAKSGFGAGGGKM